MVKHYVVMYQTIQLTPPETIATKMENPPANGNPEHIEGWSEKQPIDYTAVTSGENVTFEGQSVVRQVWQEEYGDVAPRDESIELVLFGEPSSRELRAGIDFSK